MTNLPAKPERKLAFHVTLEREEIVESFKKDPRIEWADDGNPSAFPEASGPQFQAWPARGGGIMLRHSVPAMIDTASPYVLLQFSPRVPGGTDIKGTFLRRPPSMNWSRKALWTTVVLTIAYLAIFIPLVGFAALNNGYLWGAIATIVALAVQTNRPKPESMVAYGDALRGMLGEKFVPHALGEGDQANPFRDRALPQ